MIINGFEKNKLDLQEIEYRLPIHWLLKKHGLAHYIRKTELMSQMIQTSSVNCGQALDLGCGDGRGTFELVKRLGGAFEFHGIDFSERAIAFANLMAGSIEFDVQNAKSLPFKDGTFSLVVAREVIEHIPPNEINEFLLEIYRVLLPGGILLLTTPSELRKLSEKHFQHFSPTKLCNLLKSTGYTTEQVRGFGWWPHPRFENVYRYLISLPTLWRIHVYLGTHEMPIDRADGLLVLAKK